MDAVRWWPRFRMEHGMDDCTYGWRYPRINVVSRILVVDDEDQVRQLVRIVLERAGHAVRVAGDGEEALALCAESEPDVVVTDLVMEPMGGLDLIEHLRREFPDAKIIAISPYLDTLADIRLQWADNSLRKPFTEALAVFRNQSDTIVAVLLDYRMPGGTGTEIFEEIQHIRPNVPVIMMSGYMEKVDAALSHLLEHKPEDGEA